MQFLENTSKELDKFRDYIYQQGALDSKTKFLIALSNVVALGCEPCMIYRLGPERERLGITNQEMEEAISIAIMNHAGTTLAKTKAAWKKLQL